MNRLLAAVSILSFGLVSAPALLAQSAAIDHLTMNQWVESTPDGALTGRIIGSDAGHELAGLANVDVAIIADDGKVLTATTNAQGQFTIPNVQRGVYTLMARGQGIFACSAMHVISAQDNRSGRFPKTAKVCVGNVDFTTVNTAMIRYMPPKMLTDHLSINEANFEQLADVVCGSDSFRVARSGGGMKGRIHLAGPALQGAPATNVFILQDGIEVSRAITDANGRFFVELEPGDYSLLAVGSAGVGLLGFELVDVVDSASNAGAAFEGSSQRFVVAQNASNIDQQFAMQVAPTPEVIDVVEGAFVQADSDGPGDDVAGVPMNDLTIDGFGSPVPGAGFQGYGGGGSFGGGGGGGGFGGGGIGGVAAIAAVAGVAVAASNDNGRGIIIASPSSPN